MKKNVVLGMSGIFLTFVLTFSGCASLGGLRPLGTLTITGIPAEYEGGTIDIPFAAGSGSISNGAVSIEAQSILDKTGVANLAFNVTRAGSPSVGIFFKSVIFENQTATVKWDDGVKTGLLTVTGIPAGYNRDDEKHTGSVVVLAGKDLRRGGALALLGGYTGSEASNQGWVVDGAMSIPLWFPVDGLPTPFIQNTAIRVLLDIAVGATEMASGVATAATTEGFIFESVQFTNGNANISFSQGIKQ
ncbi:hypothetical protein FACS1894151_11350 [Spirochaetia bacterium]|nr:hypothetical protein FACS1894151_11350 [Spirochaetia bacterium]